jgi:hypothetical protein
VTRAQDTILEEISSLLAQAESGRGEAPLAVIEDRLTEGYARVLQLEAERWRLERRMGDLASRLEKGDTDPGTDEIARLARRAARADRELHRMRRLLAPLRARVSALRSAGAAFVL